MPNKSQDKRIRRKRRAASNPAIDFHQPRFTQISESHCGPAVVQMLLSNLGIEITQEAVAEAGCATDLIELNGMRVDQLAEAVRVLAPQVQFWFKEHSSIEDLINLVVDYGYPVGVEWQGVFEGDDRSEEQEEPGNETEEEDYGHYSIVSHVRPEEMLLIIADPYKDYVDQDRIFSFEDFEDRWWDFNEVEDPESGRAKLIEDFHMLFIITPTGKRFPYKLGMIAAK